MYGLEHFSFTRVVQANSEACTRWIMATGYDRPSERIVERHYTSDGGIGVVIGLIVALAIGAFLFFTFYDRGSAPTVTTPTVTKTVPITPPAPAPSTK